MMAAGATRGEESHPSMTLREIERELARVLRSWRSLRDFERCKARRRELLALAAATPIASAHDAAAALGVVELAGTDGHGLITIGGLEDACLVELVRSVRRWIGGRRD